VRANVSKEISKFFCTVAANDLVKSLFLLSFEEEGGHLGFVHFGTSGGLSHARNYTGRRSERLLPTYRH
jgi:hypothetical protein